MKLTVVKSTLSANGGFINTLKSDSVKKTVFGEVISPFGKTYLIKTVKPLIDGAEFEIDPKEFELREDTFEGDDGKTITVTWLNPL